MPDNFRHKRLLALIVCAVVVPGACGPVSPNPEAMARLSNESTAASSTSTSIADINRNIAAVAMMGGTASSLDYQIGPEDLLEITLFNIPEALGMDRQVTPRTVTVRVTHRGQISLPVAGTVDVKGLTVSGLEKKIREVYDRYIHNPQVGVLIKEFRQKVSIIGAVQKPGVIELTGPKTVTEMLAMAGGVSETAGRQVHIYRQGPNGRESHVIDLSVLASNASLINADNVGLVTTPVQSGDVINVPPAGTFFVDGAVRKPGPYPLGRRYSLSQALATAGGMDPELNSSDITIFRRKGSGMEALSIDHSAIMAGSVVDPQIEADDVIVVPISTAKYVVKRFVGSLINGISIGSMVGGS